SLLGNLLFADEHAGRAKEVHPHGAKAPRRFGPRRRAARGQPFEPDARRVRESAAVLRAGAKRARRVVAAELSEESAHRFAETEVGALEERQQRRLDRGARLEQRARHELALDARLERPQERPGIGLRLAREKHAIAALTREAQAAAESRPRAGSLSHRRVDGTPMVGGARP